MANFHTNLVVIAADDCDMAGVLGLCARNLAACPERTRFSCPNLGRYESAAALFRLLAGHLEGCCEVALSGVAARDPEAGLGPEARPAGDSAAVRLDRYGAALVLSLRYETASGSGTEDLDGFFSLLDAGRYGVAALDADEADGYSTVSVLNGLHPGGGSLRGCGQARVDALVDAAALEEDARRLSGVARDGMADLAELAYAVAVCRWPEYESAQHATRMREYYDRLGEGEADAFDAWYQERFPQEIDYEQAYDRRCGAAAGGRPAGRIDWASPEAADSPRALACLADAVALLPLHALLDYDHHEVNQEAIASVLAGDELVVTSVWGERGASPPVELVVSTPDGEELGHLGAAGELWSRFSWDLGTEDVVAAVACLLPHLTARADKVVPRDLKSRRTPHSTFIVRIDLAAGAHDRMGKEACALLALPCAKRGRSSVTVRDGEGAGAWAVGR